MKREHTLRRKLASLGMLGQAVTAMKSLSAHHLRAARAGLAAARAYRAGIDRATAAAGITQIAPEDTAPGVLVLASDLGLCNGYNAQLVETTLALYRQLNATVLYCIGKRPLLALRRANIAVSRAYPAASSVSGLTQLLLTLADDVIGDYLEGMFTSLHIVSARFEGVGAFVTRTTPVLPLVPTRTGGPTVTTPYATTQHLAEVAVREYLYSTLYEMLLDAMAAEHGMRLVATQAAEQWLDDHVRDLKRQLSSVRRESSTQEVLDIAGGARQRRQRLVVQEVSV